MTLLEWCKKNNKLDYIKLWDDKNVSPDEVTIYSRRIIELRCPRGIHDNTKIRADQVIRKKKVFCKKCNSIAQFGLDVYGEDFFANVWDCDKNSDVDPWTTDRSSTKKIYLFCQNNAQHGSHPVSCLSFYTKKTVPCCQCNVRGHALPHIDDSVGKKYPYSLSVWGGDNKYGPYEVTCKSHKRIFWKCPLGKHEDYKRRVADSVLSEFRCPHCVAENKSSVIETKTKDFLCELGYRVLTEYGCNIIAPSLTGYHNAKLPYDNEIPELKLIVEVMGAQHYSSKSSWHTSIAKRNGTTPEIELLRQQERDEYKKQYALQQGYSYLAISYKDYENENYKNILLTKINEITNQESVTTE